MNEGEQINNEGEVQQEESKLQSLADLLDPTPKAEEAKADGNPSTGEPAGKHEKGKPKKFNELAGKYGEYELTENDLYKLEIAAAKDGSPITVEQLKDAWAKRDEQTVRELEFEATRTSREQDLRQQERELHALFSSLPQHARSKEAVEQMQQRLQRQMQHVGRGAIAETPEWADKAKYEAELIGIAKFAEEKYNLPKSYLTELRHPGELLLLRDFLRLKTKVDKALADVKERKPTTTPAAKPQAKGPRKPNSLSAQPRKPSSHNKLEQLFSEL